MDWKDAKIARLVDAARTARMERDQMKMEMLTMKYELESEKENNVLGQVETPRGEEADGIEGIAVRVKSPPIGAPLRAGVVENGGGPRSFGNSSRANVGDVDVVVEDTETLWKKKAHMSLARLKACQLRASNAESEARTLKSKFDCLQMERDSVEDELASYRKKYSELKQDAANVKFELDRLRHKQASSTACGGGDNDDDDDELHAEAAHVSQKDALLVEQLEKMALQLQAAKAESAILRQEVDGLKKREVDKVVESQSSAAVLIAANRDLEAALNACVEDARQKSRDLSAAAETIHSLSSENTMLHEKCKSLEQAMQDAAASRKENEVLRQRLKETEEQLADAREKIMHMEEDWANTSDNKDDDIVTSLRSDLLEREEQLALVEEQLHEQRKRSSSLHEQVLTQIMAIEDAKKDKIEVRRLKIDLEASNEECENLRVQFKRLNDKNMLRNLKKEMDDMERKLSQKDETIMLLEGQVRLLRQNDSWLTE